MATASRRNGEEPLKLLVTGPQGRTSLVDFTSLLDVHKALEEFCKANENTEGSYDYDACQGQYHDDIAHESDGIAEQILELLKKPAIPQKIRDMDRTLIVTILETYGFGCVPGDSLDTLQEALRVNVEDGTISQSALKLETI